MVAGAILLIGMILLLAAQGPGPREFFVPGGNLTVGETNSLSPFSRNLICNINTNDENVQSQW